MDLEQERHLTQIVDAVILSWDKCTEDSDLTPVQTDEKMRSSFSYDAAATLEHDPGEPLSVLDDHRIPEGCPQSVSDPPSYCIRAAGVLRYNRESDNHRKNFTTILPVSQNLTEYPVKCDYCGEKAKPSLDLSWVQWPELHLFCCARWQQLCEMLVKRRCLVWGTCDLSNGTSTSQGDKPAKETMELLFRGREMEDHNKFIVDLPSGLGEKSEPRINEDYSIQLPVAETSTPKSKVLSFRLSCAPGKGCRTVCPRSATEKHLKIKEEEKQVLIPFFDHKPLQFGICHHQCMAAHPQFGGADWSPTMEVKQCTAVDRDGAQFLQKYYSNGMKFLTVFPDGSAQVFYPSGLLALVVVVTEENGRVCIVYDDSDNQPVRAMFQSDGRATCYHSNGNIWLALNRSGGQCLDEEGARVRRWSWSSLSLTPTPLLPIFLPLNKIVGVRVLGRGQVFVSFLASGRQAKFSVGACCAQCECKTEGASQGPSVLKEELFVLAARIKIYLAIQHLQQYLMTPFHPRLPKTTQAPHLHVAARRLLADSADVMMSDSDRAFIHQCLQDCL